MHDPQEETLPEDCHCAGCQGHPVMVEEGGVGVWTLVSRNLCQRFPGRQRDCAAAQDDAEGRSTSGSPGGKQTRGCSQWG